MVFQHYKLLERLSADFIKTVEMTGWFLFDGFLKQFQRVDKINWRRCIFWQMQITRKNSSVSGTFHWNFCTEKKKHASRFSFSVRDREIDFRMQFKIGFSHCITWANTSSLQFYWRMSFVQSRFIPVEMSHGISAFLAKMINIYVFFLQNSK